MSSVSNLDGQPDEVVVIEAATTLDPERLADLARFARSLLDEEAS